MRFCVRTAVKKVPRVQNAPGAFFSSGKYCSIQQLKVTGSLVSYVVLV